MQVRTFDDLMKMERPETFDFKCVDERLAEISDGVARFLRYRQIDCEDRDTLDVTADIYEKVYGAKDAPGKKKDRYFEVDGVLLESDTVNSFWTTYRALLEYCVKEYIRNYMELGISKEFFYEFIVLFGGVDTKIRSKNKISKRKMEEYGLCDEDAGAAYSYFSDYENLRTLDSKMKLNWYVSYCLEGQASNKDLEAERLEWLYKNHATMKNIIVAACSETTYVELEKFARLTHAIGNFCLVPYQFNMNRAPLTDDYWDLSLVTLQGYAGKGNWYGEGVRWFAKHFSDVLKLDVYFERVQEESFYESKVRPLFLGHSFIHKKPVNAKEFEEFLVTVNRCVKERGKRLMENGIKNCNNDISHCMIDESVFKDYDPDSSDFTWEHVYKDQIRNSEWKYWKIFDLENLKSVSLMTDKTEKKYYRLVATLNTKCLDSDPDFAIFKTTYFQTLKIGGDTLFNFKSDRHNKCYTYLKNQLHDNNQKLILDDYSKRHHCLKNFGLMLVTGNMNGFKGNYNDRFDKYVYYLRDTILGIRENICSVQQFEREIIDYGKPEKEDRNKDIEDKIENDAMKIREQVRKCCRNKITALDRSAQGQLPALIIFLSLFNDINEYCKVMYGLTDEAYIDWLCKSGEKDINSAERVEEYLDLAQEFWKRRSVCTSKPIDETDTEICIFNRQ